MNHSWLKIFKYQPTGDAYMYLNEVICLNCGVTTSVAVFGSPNHSNAWANTVDIIMFLTKENPNCAVSLMDTILK